MARVRSAVVVALLAIAAVLALRAFRGGSGHGVGDATSAYGAARPRTRARQAADGAAWLDDDAAVFAAWRPRWQWPVENSTLPAVVDVVQWSARPEWRRSLFRRAHPAIIQGSPAGRWPALDKWRSSGSKPHHICSLVDTLPNVMTPTEHASPPNTFFYLNPNGERVCRGVRWFHTALTMVVWWVAPCGPVLGRSSHGTRAVRGVSRAPVLQSGEHVVLRLFPHPSWQHAGVLQQRGGDHVAQAAG